MGEPIVIPGKEVEFVTADKIPEPEPVKIKKKDPAEMIKHLRKEFKKEIKREITEEELATYIKLYEKGETNFWIYAKRLKETESGSSSGVSSLSQSAKKTDSKQAEV